MEEKNYLGCGLLFGFRKDRTIWYVCSSKDGLNTPTFYNYDRSKPTVDLRNRQMVSISSSTKMFKFTNGITEKLSLPFWMNKLGGKDLEPEQHCKFEKGESVSSYNLKCHDYTIPKPVQF